MSSLTHECCINNIGCYFEADNKQNDCVMHYTNGSKNRISVMHSSCLAPVLLLFLSPVSRDKCNWRCPEFDRKNNVVRSYLKDCTNWCVAL